MPDGTNLLRQIQISGDNEEQRRTMPGVSIRPSEFVEGGAVPVDQNLTWRECRFNLFDYGGKAPVTCAARITYVSDEGQEFIQQYSVSDPERFLPSQDGKKLVSVGTAEALAKSSNFYILMNALINAGFPENKLSEDGDVSVLDGLYTYNIGLPEPKRVGLARQAVEGAREKVLSVPSQILRLPWEKGKGKAKGATAAEIVEEAGGDIASLAVDFIAKQIAQSESGSVERQELAVAVFKDLAKDENKDAIATFIFSPACSAALLATGFKVEGESISKA